MLPMAFKESGSPESYRFSRFALRSEFYRLFHAENGGAEDAESCGSSSLLRVLRVSA
jgi:hypothetical protein